MNHHRPGKVPHTFNPRALEAQASLRARPGLHIEFKAGQGYIERPLKKNSYDNLPLVKFTDKSLQAIASHCPSLKLTSALHCRMCDKGSQRILDRLL